MEQLSFHGCCSVRTDVKSLELARSLHRLRVKAVHALNIGDTSGTKNQAAGYGSDVIY